MKGMVSIRPNFSLCRLYWVAVCTNNQQYVLLLVASNCNKNVRYQESIYSFAYGDTKYRICGPIHYLKFHTHRIMCHPNQFSFFEGHLKFLCNCKFKPPEKANLESLVCNCIRAIYWVFALLGCDPWIKCFIVWSLWCYSYTQTNVQE